ncbi:MAG TPA: hypothetical protein VI790_06490 [Candidatus Nanoarchaeia archaeon]|nr:hypothetical protein [Candidatus Nanoarchaeia archaeon]
MESGFKVTGVLIVLTIVITYSFSLIDGFINYSATKGFADDITSIKSLVDSLKSISSEGSFDELTVSVPTGYYLLFDNVSDKLEISGIESLSVDLGANIIYLLNLSPGVYSLQFYYGNAFFNESKKMVVFK